MPKYLLENRSGHRFESTGRTLMEAKMKLCKYLMADWRDPYEGARSYKLIEVLEDNKESEQKNINKEGVA